ncbi:MAG: histidine phosphatase family protein [Turicibacter sp.]
MILVTHGMVISVLMSYLSKGKLGSDYRELKNTCINYLSKTEDGWQIDLYNHSVLK